MNLLWQFVRQRRGRQRRSYCCCSGGGGGGGVEALLAHVVGGWVSRDAAVVDAKRYRFWNLEFRLFLACFLSHFYSLSWVFFYQVLESERFPREEEKNAGKGLVSSGGRERERDMGDLKGLRGR
ncbi:hypothetical protein F2P56_031538 [Juglans regia]|uniref:Uncharacterized protein n=1 Tax=Juglans regia TaxID=51240 RepID=A0A833WW96_JUGRE|nr:hypothetical protein F2P56_031538 [Juglans regia]